MDGYNPYYPVNMQRGTPQMNRSNRNTLTSPLQYTPSPQSFRHQNTGSMTMRAPNYPGYNRNVPQQQYNRSQIYSNQRPQNYKINPRMIGNQNVNTYNRTNFQQPFPQTQPVMQ